ncbi:hypothetical protein E2C01_062410 [Portunus trituberculatus]|uniref:Uncharacterized protein n=1 Tax=Portunus trituberculatus TaxID=210409 RepID=A0A5B7HDK2_PORTR|nr:hypothetical protein [Portunus trituberculatus]
MGIKKLSESNSCILKRLASQHNYFSKATGIINQVLKCISPANPFSTMTCFHIHSGYYLRRRLRSDLIEMYSNYVKEDVHSSQDH